MLLSDINESAVLKAAEIVRQQFPSSEAEGIKCDVSKEADVKAMIDRAVEKWGRLDVLVGLLCQGWMIAKSSSTMLGSCTRRECISLETRKQAHGQGR